MNRCARPVPRSRRTVASIAALALLPIFVACGSARRSEPVAGPFPTSDPGLTLGELLFDRHCNSCHVGGEASLAPSLNDKPLPRFLIRAQTRLGLGAMPSFTKSELSDEELRLIADYLKALRHHASG